MPMTSYRRSIATMGLSRTVSEIKGDFGQKSKQLGIHINGTNEPDNSYKELKQAVRVATQYASAPAS